MHPILLKIGPITVYSYGVMVSLAFAVCAFLIWYNAPLARIPREKVLDLVIVILISGIIGARALHVILNFNYYRIHPLDTIMLFKGGLAFHGALISSLIGAIVFLKINAVPICSTADLVAPYAALGQAIGRIGCFLNGCCFGKISGSGYFGVIFSGAYGSVATLVDRATEKRYRVRRGDVVGNARVVEIQPEAVVLQVTQFGVTRSETLRIRKEEEEQG